MSYAGTYSPLQVSIVAASIPIPGGYAAGDFCKITPLADSFGSEVGTDGTVVRYKILDDRAEVEITLMQGAPANQLLSALYNLDRNSENGAGVGAMLIRNIGGTTLYAAGHSWIKRRPDLLFSDKPGPRAWMFECAKLIGNEGALI